MKTSTAIAVLGALVVIIILGVWFAGPKPATTTTTTDQNQNQNQNPPLAIATFACNEGKSISATFYQSSADIKLSDGRAMSLPKATSGSGIRYTNQDESFVFWGKGNTAFVTEGQAQTQTYQGCILVAPDQSGALSQIYATSTLGISLRFPANYVLDPAYVYQALGPGKGIHGVKVTIPAPVTTGTNLSKDTYLSVEELPTAKTCTADLFLATKKVGTFSDSGVDYSVATTSDAAAGNRYDEAVFAIPGSSPCTAVRYFIHSTNVGNYPEGTVTEFNKTGLINEFDLIRRSLVLGR
jgi:membrane-bound inhibitor of C-type lysozyme